MWTNDGKLPGAMPHQAEHPPAPGLSAFRFKSENEGRKSSIWHRALSCTGCVRARRHDATNGNTAIDPPPMRVWSRGGTGPPSESPCTTVEAAQMDYHLPVALIDAQPDSLLGMWKFEREAGSLDGYLKELGVPWVLRVLITQTTAQHHWYVDEEGEVQPDTLGGQKKQLVRCFLEHGQQVGEPEAYALKETMHNNPVLGSPMTAKTTWSNGKLERRLTDSLRPERNTYTSWQVDSAGQMVEIGGLGEHDTFYYARVYTRVR
jgi:hypothetical protein